MSDSNRWTKPNFRTDFTRSKITKTVVGQRGAPNEEQVRSQKSLRLGEVKNGDDLWILNIEINLGFGPPTELNFYFLSEAEANERHQYFPSFGPGRTAPFGKRLLDFTADPSNNQQSRKELSSCFLEHGLSEEFLALNALQGAGIHSNIDELSDHVAEWIGESDINHLKEISPENWQILAELDYCLSHFSPTSLVTLAAKQRFHERFTEDRFSAGYYACLMRQIDRGGEEVAIAARNAQKNRTKGSSQASRKARMRRLNIFMEEIEALADAIPLVSEARIFDEAWEKATLRAADMPKTPGFKEDYGIELRSKEPFKARYQALFRKTA